MRAAMRVTSSVKVRRPSSRGADVEEVDQLVGPCEASFAPSLHGVADPQPLEVDSLDGLTVAMSRQGNYSFCKHRSSASKGDTSFVERLADDDAPQSLSSVEAADVVQRRDAPADGDLDRRELLLQGGIKLPPRGRKAFRPVKCVGDDLCNALWQKRSISSAAVVWAVSNHPCTATFRRGYRRRGLRRFGPNP